MFWKLLLAFTIIPAVELYLLVTVGQWIGPLATVLIIVLTGLVGAALAKQEGMAVLQQLKQDLGKGLPPAAHLVEGAMVLAGGLLLLTPGLLTDLSGFVLIMPFTRTRLSPLLSVWLIERFGLSISGMGAGAGVSAAEPKPTPRPTPRPTPKPTPRSNGRSTPAVPDSPFDHPVS